VIGVMRGSRVFVVKRGTDSDNLFNVGGNDMRHEELPAVCVRACPVRFSIKDSEEDSSSRARERWIARATDKEPHYLVTVDLQPVTPTGSAA